ncbi:MAG: hypothetical protein GYB31_10935 [Bacteroidetes bacterium]|nr:hypothetical protein [Bacteroidota bacterium]
MIPKKDLEYFLSIDLDAHSRQSDLGEKNFDAAITPLKEIKGFLDEMVNIALALDDLPQQLLEELDVEMVKFNKVLADIKNYDLDRDNTGFGKRSEIIKKINEWLRSIYKFKNSQGHYVNLLNLYNTFKNLAQVDFDLTQKEARQVLTKLKEQRSESAKILKEQRNAAAEQTISDYSVLFEKEANKHSSLKLWPFQIGFAQLWFLGAVGLLVLFFAYFNDLNSLIPVDFGDSAVEVVVGNLITRLLVISLAIYVISFCFRQFSINLHLYTVNKHRQNVLESFRLFIETTGKEDPSIRTTLMLEVAKAIYEIGATGYLSGKNLSDNNPSIIELTKVIKE